MAALLSMTPSAAAEVKRENDTMEISESTFAPGARSDEHSHPANEATYVIAGGRMKYSLADGTVRTVELKTGDVRWRAEAETHVAENVGDTVVRLLAIRVKATTVP